MEETRKDEVFVKLLYYLNQAWPTNKYEDPGDLRNYCLMRNELFA